MHLRKLDRECIPKQIIHDLSESLLGHYQEQPLLDGYGVYQHCMDYWAETMQDDCYFIAADGWVATPQRVIETIKSGKNKGKQKDKGWACDLVPKPYIVARYFATEQAEIEQLQTKLETVAATLTELGEEHGGEGSVLQDVSKKAEAQDACHEALLALWQDEEQTACNRYLSLVEAAGEFVLELQELKGHDFFTPLKNNKGNLTLKTVNTRLAILEHGEEMDILQKFLATDKALKKAAKDAGQLFADAETEFLARLGQYPLPDNFTDLQVVVRYLDLLDQQAALKMKIKEKEKALDTLAYKKYPQLTPEEVKTLVIDDKWLTTLAKAVQGEIDLISQTLTSRIRELAQRYQVPLPEMTDQVAELEEKVKGHLHKMGFVWN